MSTTMLEAKPARTKPAKRLPKPEATALDQPQPDGTRPAFELLPIPLKYLVPSTLNVRKTHGNTVAELAASIRAHGLLHNLTVTAQADLQGQPTGTYEVVTVQAQSERAAFAEGFQPPFFSPQITWVSLPITAGTTRTSRRCWLPRASS
jgi:hypothetical protein